MHLDVMSDEATLFKSFQYKKLKSGSEGGGLFKDLINCRGTISYAKYFGDPVDRLAIFTSVRWLTSAYYYYY